MITTEEAYERALEMLERLYSKKRTPDVLASETRLMKAVKTYERFCAREVKNNVPTT